MDNYQKQANEFLEKNKTTFKSTFKGETVNKLWNDNKTRYFYSFTLKNANGSYTGKFYGSINDYQRNIQELTAYDVLAAITKYDVGTFKDFCQCFGYNDNSKNDEKIYKLVKKEYQGMKKLFNDDQLKELEEIQ